MLRLGAAIVMVMTGVTVWLGLNQKEIRIVVLPYEHLGSVKDEDFTAGIAIDITDHVAKIHKLRVISPRSAMNYDQADKDTGQIAKDLRVDYLLEGTIEHERSLDPDSSVVIKSRLIQASDDTLVWSWTDDTTVIEVDQIPSNVAIQVAHALDIKLLQSEQKSLAHQPTKSREAYLYYRRGNVYSSRGYQIERNVNMAIQLYEKAIGLDDQFALAYAKLSQAYSGRYRFGNDPNKEERLAMAKNAVERAFDLAPELPEAYWALGFYYYWGLRDCGRALEHFAIARKGRPNDSRLIAAMAYAQRFQGKFELALANIKAAYELSPFDPVFAKELGKTLMDMRKYTKAAQYCQYAIELAPESPGAYEWMACIHLRQQGNTKDARNILEERLRHVTTDGAARARLVYWLVEIDIYEEKYPDALARLEVDTEETIDTTNYNRALRYARIYGYMHEKDIATKYLRSAQKTLDKKTQRIHGYIVYLASLMPVSEKHKKRFRRERRGLPCFLLLIIPGEERIESRT